MSAIKTVCSRCAMGCGVRAMVGSERKMHVEGDRIHPANMGWLCPAGKALAEAGDLDGRLLHPRLNGLPIGYDRAIVHAAKRLADIVTRHGAESVALHVAGDLPTEDYFVANKLMKGFIGSANIDTPWQETAGQAHAAAFGEDVMPASVEDIDRADLILVIGASALLRHPLLRRRVDSAREERGAQLLVIDSDPEASSLSANLHLRPAPGSIATLLGGLLLSLYEADLLDRPFLAEHVAVPAGYWNALRPGHDLWSVARATNMSIDAIRIFQERVAKASRMVTLFDPDVGDGFTREAGAIVALHLATGRVGGPGAAPLALPGAPNAMGAREAGCTASVLAAHRDFSDEARAAIGRFWSTDRLATGAGLTGVALREAIAAGRIKALLMLGDGPDSLLDALPGNRPFTLFAGERLDWGMSDRVDLALPMPDALERNGTLTNADRLISRQRPVFAPPGEARPAWWIMTQIARAMGWRSAFHYEHPADIYREHARLTAYQNDGSRLFDLRRHASISNPAYDELTPWRWGGAPFDEGHFPTPDGRARLMPPGR